MKSRFSTPKRHQSRAAQSPSPQAGYGHIYKPQFVSQSQRQEMLTYLLGLHPIWEERYSKNNPAPDGQNRMLLRPVYWLGNWQFACLDYYHPPKGLLHRCVRAEPYPVVIQNLVAQIENLVFEKFEPRDIPKGWCLNTCLINYYGSQILPDGKKMDTARVGEHKDFEPGPVGSISFGERALIQFVASHRKGEASRVVLQQWLEDSSLQIFGGDRLKKQLFHRVQRVDKREGYKFILPVESFETRRINLTFRYVPWEHIERLQALPATAQEDTLPYMRELAKNSEYFKGELAGL